MLILFLLITRSFYKIIVEKSGFRTALYNVYINHMQKISNNTVINGFLLVFTEL